MSTRADPTLFDHLEQYIVDEAFECVLRDNEAYRREVQCRLQVRQKRNDGVKRPIPKQFLKRKGLGDDTQA
jgi:hypothetical protein